MSNILESGIGGHPFYTTHYIDAQGQLQTGYIIDGKTYKDKQKETRIEIGSIVETKSGVYKLTSNGSTKLTGNLEDYIREQGTEFIAIDKSYFEEREVESILGKDEHIDYTTKRDFFQNFDGLEIEIEFGDGSKKDILKNVFLRDETLNIDGSGRHLSKAIQFIAQDLEEVD